MTQGLPTYAHAAPLRLVRTDRGGRLTPAPSRAIPAECAVAISYNGSAQAVMMATPADLEDFARGFTLTEGLAAPQDIERIEILPRRPDESEATTLPSEAIEVSIWLRREAATRLAERRRSRAGPVGCGLCGIEELAEALRLPPKVSSNLALSGAEILQASAALRAYQPLHDLTRAVHAAAFWQPGKGIVMAREDVGRHNALDKLIGGLLAAKLPGGSGAVVLTSRVSVDMVQKVARLGAPIIIAVSAPTRAALELAAELGITLIALARGDSAEVFTHPGRICGVTRSAEAPPHPTPAAREA